jgi:hypothetical protein
MIYIVSSSTSSFAAGALDMKILNGFAAGTYHSVIKVEGMVAWPLVTAYPIKWGQSISGSSGGGIN